MTTTKITKMIKKIALSITLFCSLALSTLAWAAHNHQAMTPMPKSTTTCIDNSIVCAKTVTAAFAPNGDLWRLWSNKGFIYFDISKDAGKTYAKPQQVAIAAEKISARNENRPKIAFDHDGGVYLSWAMARERKYTADVRFSFSADYGKTFSKPVTVNNDKLLAGHSFNELIVKPDGEVNIVWLDSRFSTALKKQGKKTNGSALFLASANIRKNELNFNNQELTNGTCVCCRIAIDLNQQGELAILWRHIYGDNIREFALLTLAEDKQVMQPIQISHDYWQINGCPHQGGGIAIDENNRYHLVWFNQGDKGKGIFYANSDKQGQSLSTPLSMGEFSAQAAHPHIGVNGNEVNIVWTQFNGVEHQLWQQKSTDFGKTFSHATQLANATNGADRPFIITHKGKSYVSWQRPNQGHWLAAL